MVSSSKGRRNIESDDTLFTSQYVKSFTPRSKEACKMLGVMPKELILRSFESFDKPGLTPEIARLRYKDYEQLRQETIHMVRQQRRDLVQSGWQPISKTKQRGKNGQQMVLYSSRSTSSLRRPGTTTLEMEQARMNKIMARQNKEIEAMMVYEVKMAELLSRQEKKLAFRKHREEEEREKRKMERYKVAEKRRLWEIAKKEDEEREAKKREAAALLLLEQERRRDMELQRLEEDRKKQAKKKQAERRKKKIMLEKRTQQILEAQLAMMEIKNREMQGRHERNIHPSVRCKSPRALCLSFTAQHTTVVAGQTNANVPCFLAHGHSTSTSAHLCVCASVYLPSFLPVPIPRVCIYMPNTHAGAHTPPSLPPLLTYMYVHPLSRAFLYAQIHIL